MFVYEKNRATAKKTPKNNDVHLNCMNQVQQSHHYENMGVCQESDLNTKQHLGKYLGLSLLNSRATPVLYAIPAGSIISTVA